MITSDPKLPQLAVDERGEFVGQSFWGRFQERFYFLWRDLSAAVDRMVRAPSSSTDNQVVRFDGGTGKLVQGSSLYVTDDGRVYGTALHNNAGAVTGTTNQYVASGTYTPTYTGVDNCDSVSAFECQWLRVGNVVTVSGIVNVDATNAASGVRFRATLPIASSLAAARQLAGVGRGTGINSVAAAFAVSGDSTNDAADFFGGVTDASSAVSVYFTFTYLVL